VAIFAGICQVRRSATRSVVRRENGRLANSRVGKRKRKVKYYQHFDDPVTNRINGFGKIKSLGKHFAFYDGIFR
jgi:hypothetical protein